MDNSRDGSTRYLMLSIVFGACMAALMSSYIMTAILKDYHATVFQMVFVQVVGTVGGFLGFPMAILVRNQNHKSVIIRFLAINRILIVFFPAILLCPWIGRTSVPMLIIILIAIMGLNGAVPSGSTQAWFKAILPEDLQATILGTRTALQALIVTILTPIVGFFMEHYRGMGLKPDVFYSMVLLIAAGFGLCDIYLLSKVRETPSPPKTDFREVLAEVRQALRDKSITRVVVLFLVVQCTYLFLSPFFLLMYYDTGLTKFAVGIAVTAGTLGAAVGWIIGGYLADQLRLRMIFFACSVVITLCQAGFLCLTFGVFTFGMSQTFFLGLLTVMVLIYSCCQGCIGAAMTKYTFASVRRNSSVSFSLIACFQNFLSFLILTLAAKLGGFLDASAELLRGYLWRGFYYMQLLFLLAILIGVATNIFIWTAKDFDVVPE